jgi:hypothetical protein
MIATWSGAYDEDQLPNANYFIKGVAEKGYKVDFPKNAAGKPVTTNDLFKNYAAYDWTVVNAAESRKGTIAVWQGGAGFVIDDGADGVKVLYSSAKLNGQIKEERLSSLVDDSKVKFMLPKSYIAAAVKENKNNM